jgi:hypothetical protein
MERKRLGRLAQGTAYLALGVSSLFGCGEKDEPIQKLSSITREPQETPAGRVVPTLVSDHVVNRALFLDGRMDGLKIEDAEALRLTGPFTIEARVKLTKREGLDRVINPSGGNAILSKKDAYGFFASHIGCSPRGGLAAEINDDLICIDSKAPEGEFVHLAVSYDQEFVTFYINGQRVAVQTKRDGININTQALFVGRIDTGLVTNAFGGEKDWVAMWGRALTDREIALHASGVMHGNMSRRGDLVLFLPFDENFEDIGERYKVTPLGEPKLVEVR